MSDTVGFIGVGIMGKGMCHNLIRSGKKLVVWNRTKSVAEELAAEEECKGKVTVVDTPAQVVEQATLIYSMLSTPEASQAVFPLVLPSITKGKMIVDCATLECHDMQQMDKAITEKGGLFLEAPVSGSKGPAEAGQLIFLCAGSEAVKDAAEADLTAMGKATHYFGPLVGKGTKMKLIVNMIMGTQLNAVAEGMSLCEGVGMDTNTLVEILGQGAMASPMIKLKGPMMANQNYPAQFPLKHAQKDMRFAVQLGDKHGVALPVSAASNESYKQARNQYGDNDFSAVIETTRPQKEAKPQDSGATKESEQQMHQQHPLSRGYGAPENK